ncbi:MAG: hypothetical protein JOZ47_18280 [Kutzneria sp.]|nr:hypothetical protein [Kutzneria sp.]MBV9846990.1 hypothetical protein [Kutzneria sp.]
MRRQQSNPSFTISVEEDFLLVDFGTGRVGLAAPDMERLLVDESAVTSECMRNQMEAATSVRAGLREVRVGRESSAACSPVRPIASVTCSRLALCCPSTPRPPCRRSPTRRVYRQLVDQIPAPLPDTGTYDRRVHVGVQSPSRDASALSRPRS